MPGGINGRQFADGDRALRRELKVLFITGYADNAAIGNGLLGPGLRVLTKPFTVVTLARRFRELADARGDCRRSPVAGEPCSSPRRGSEAGRRIRRCENDP